MQGLFTSRYPRSKDNWQELWKFLFSSSHLYFCDVKFIWTILSYLNFLLLKPSDRLSSFPLETFENKLWLSGSIWISKRKVSDSDRQQPDREQICLAFDSAGLFKINFIEEFCREDFSYTTRLLLIWRKCSSSTKNKFLNSYFVWRKMKTEKQVCL